MMRWKLRILVLAAVAVAVPACGGGGGGGGGGAPAANGLLSGLYHALSFRNSWQGGSHTDASRSGTGTFDGLGGATVSTTDNADGTVSGPTVRAWTYSVAADRTLAAAIPVGLSSLSGGVLAAGDLALAATVSPASRPEIWLFARKGGATFSNADLSGDYFLCTFAVEPTAPLHRSRTGTVTFDGMGGYASSLTRNDEGVITGPAASAGTYAVAADGAFSFVDGTATSTGGVLAGGTVAIAGSTSPLADPEVLVLVKKGGAFTDASLSGDYFACMFEFDLAAASHRSETGLITFDGAGALAYSWTVNDYGTIVPVSGVGTYGVAPDGTVTSVSGGETLSGGVLNGGSVAVVASTSAGSDPQLLILLKK